VTVSPQTELARQRAQVRADVVTAVVLAAAGAITWAAAALIVVIHG